MRKLLLVLTAFLFFAGQVFAQKTITGKVTDDKGTPLANVSVTVKGTSTGTVTKADGTYSLTVPANAKQLEFSYVGLVSQTVNITASKTVYSLSLAAAGTSDLDEVVVTGISRVKKSQFAGAANKIDAKEMANKPVGSLDQLLQGRAPGVLALTTSGQPGNNSVVIIRGQNSVVGGSTPLYVVDGIPVEASVFQGYNPNDFASIDILRDAASLSQYGSRGSAGVIVVTTKRGQSGKMQLSYTGQYGIKSRPDFAFRPMNTAEVLKAQEDYGKIVGGAQNTNTVTPGWYYSKSNPRYIALTPAQQAQADYLLDSISKIDINWSDNFFRQGNFSNHQVNLSGGTGKTRLFTSVALYNEEGTTTRTDMKRATVRNNVDYADDKLTFSLSSNFGYVKRNFQQTAVTNSTGNPFLATNIQVPYAMVYKPDGSYATGVGSKFVGANQLDLTKYDMNYNDQFKGTLGINIGYKITKDVTVGLVAGVDFRETQNTNYQSREAFLRTPAGTSSITTLAGSQIESMERNLTSNIRPSVTYRKLIAEKHDLEVTALGEYIQENYKFFNLQGYGIDPRTPNTPGVIQPGNATNQLYIVAGGNKERTGLASGLGLLRYTYNGKYTVTGSLRADGSSKLPEENRWVNFWSAGLVWDASKEDFMQNVNFVNSLRVRASYGGSGNANNFPRTYLYQATYGSGSYSGIPTQVATYPGVPDAKWETTWVTNFGLDFELLKRRLYGDLNFYDKRTKDLFLRKQLPAEAGGFTLDINAGELQNKGFEWNINGEVIRNKNLVWTLFTTGGYNKNELLDIGGQQPFEQGTSYINVGLPLGTHYTVRWGGVDAATGQPLYYTKDGVLTTTYNASNNVSDFGTWEAPWKGGFGTSLRYKGFDLNILFSWQEGAYKMDNLEYFVENPVGFLSVGYNQSSDLKFWQKPGDIVNTPSPLYGTNFSSKLIHNASFVRIRDITLGYTVPKSVTEKLKFVSNINIYVQGTNLYMWTKWRGMDPEAGPVNINLSEFPNPRAFTGGVTVTF
ncbi:MAG TPA: SusC/RagA family TonB-linked outer membrane protein [Chitinophagaceae bacterium]